MPSNAIQAPNSTRTFNISSSLSPSSFAPFGQVIQNPATHAGQPSSLRSVIANQGSATKWIDVTKMENWYHLAKSKKPAKSVVNMFVSQPRQLSKRDERPILEVRVLERHPFTPQTFIPLGLSKDDESTKYLVIVAPTLKTTSKSERQNRVKPYPAEYHPPKKTLKERLLGARPNPFTNDFAPSTTPSKEGPGSLMKPRGPGEPDLDNLQAFIARGDQAVTYAPGTWHAPMVVLGERDIDFVVVQYANGVGLEDCQEFEIGEGTISVDIDPAAVEATAPGIMRAKL